MVFKTRLFCFTNFKLDFDYQNLIDSSSAEYCIIGYEICPKTKKPHHQGFVYFSGALTCHKNKEGVFFSKRVNKLLDSANHRACSGNLDQNCNYCIKDDHVQEFGKEPKQGHRTDLDAIKDNILNHKLTVDDIAIEHPNIYHCYGRTLNKLEDIALRRKWRTEMTKGIWYWGETNIGKSHIAHEGYNPDSHYIYPNDKGWWDGYKGQATVIMNEFRETTMSFNELLELCDKWPKTVRRRCREPVPFLAKTIIVTSALAPEDVFKSVCDDKDSFKQFQRRFNVIKLEQKWSKGNTEDSLDNPTGNDNGCLISDNEEDCPLHIGEL